jgi:hypothetical protein
MLNKTRISVLYEPNIEFQGNDIIPSIIKNNTRIAVLSEPNTDTKINTKYLMEITGGDTIKCRLLFNNRNKKFINSKL